MPNLENTLARKRDVNNLGASLNEQIDALLARIVDLEVSLQTALIPEDVMGFIGVNDLNEMKDVTQRSRVALANNQELQNSVLNITAELKIQLTASTNVINTTLVTLSTANDQNQIDHDVISDQVQALQNAVYNLLRDIDDVVNTSGFIDHGQLGGLGDIEDHPQYSLVDGTRAFTGTVGGITPVAGTDLTTKAYVDATGAGAGVSDLPDLNDVTITAPVSGQVLTYDGTLAEWINQSGQFQVLDSLHDVVTVTPIANNEVLAWDSASNTWINQTADEAGLAESTGHTHSLDNLIDVVITAPSDGEVLKYSGGNWINDVDTSGTTINTIDDILDVTVIAAESGHILLYDGTTWINMSGQLSNLDDVKAEAPSVGDIIRWSGSEWIKYPDSNYAAAVHGHDAGQISDFGTTVSGLVTFETLDANSDVGITSTQVAAGDHLHDSNYSPIGHSHVLSDLNDVDASGDEYPSDSDVLMWNTSSGAWLPRVVDHADLSGLGVDDHTQYTLADGTRAFTGTVDGVNPTLAPHLTTKAYVDSTIGASGSDYAEAAHTHALDDLSDVRVAGDDAPANQEVLTWFSASGAWLPAVASGGGGGSVAVLDDLTDVTITSATDGDILRHNGSTWVDELGEHHFSPSGHQHTASEITDFYPEASGTVTYEALSDNGDIGTGATQVAQGDHDHDGTYALEGHDHFSTDITNFDDAVGSGVTFENLDDNMDVGASAGQVASGVHTHLANGLQLGVPTDGTYTDGLLEFTNGTFTADAIDELNETLSFLAPADANTLEATALSLSGASKFSGRLAGSATSTYKSGDGSGSTVSYIMNDMVFDVDISPSSTTTNKGDEGVLRLNVNGVEVDMFDLAAAFEETEREGLQSYPPSGTASGHIVIDDVRFYNDFPKWQKVNATCSFSGVNFIEGYNFISLVHDVTIDQTSTTFDLFNDTDVGSDPSVNTPTLSPQTPTGSGWRSGVQYMTSSDTFNLSVVGSDCFDNVYHATSPLTHSGLTAVSNGNIDHDDSSVTGLDDPPIATQTMTVTNKVLTITAGSSLTTNPRVTITPRDPYASYSTGQSASQTTLVSTYVTTSTTTREDFNDENRRLPLTFNFESTSDLLTGQWPSMTTLSNGNAQQYITGSAHSLLFPAVNFTTFFPVGPNYSAFSGDQLYTRCLVSSSGEGSVDLQFDGLPAAGIGALGAGDVNIEIKLPTQTAWLDCATAFDSGEGVDDDGDGCLSGSISGATNATLTATFGGKSTNDSGNRVYIRITFRNSTRTMTRIEATNW